MSARASSRRPGGTLRRAAAGPRRTLATFAALGAALLAGCGGDRHGDAATYPDAPIVLISIDTLRSDRLPAYGYAKGSTPALDGLARDGILFERAYSHVPLTLPSHASMFSGQLPTVHGVRDNLGYRFDGEAHPTLASGLAGRGYVAAGFASAFVLRAETGIDAGFGTWDADVSMRFAEVMGNSQRPGAATVAAARQWLASAAPDRPFFLFVHLYDPHTPYEAPEPFRSRHPDPYDAEIAAADAAVGTLLADLRERGLYEKTTIAVVSDHGEGLGDHGEVEHGILLYREALQVPLLLKLPGGDRAGTRVAEPVQLVDLFPTLLGLAGVDPAAAAGAPLPGRSLLAPPGEPREIYAESYYARLHFGWSELTSLLRDRYHYIHGPDPELYDVVADPGQRSNVLRERRTDYARLRDSLAGLRTELQGPGAVDEDTRRRMGALGYANAQVQVAAGEELPDPKSRIHTLDDLQKARNLVAAHRLAEAVPLLERLLAAEPRLVDGWEQLGAARFELGRFAEAHDAYRQAMERSGGAPHIALATGNVLFALGRLEEAAQHAELGLAAGLSGAHDLLARVALEREDLATAERHARQAVEGRGEQILPLLTLAQVQTKVGRLQEALATAETAARELAAEGGEQRFQGLRFVRGDVLARLGRAEEAERELIAEIEQFPFDPRAYAALAALYVASGEPAAATTTLRALVERNPRSPMAWAQAVETLRVLGDPDGADRLLARARTLHPNHPQLEALAG